MPEQKAEFWTHYHHDADIGIRGCGTTVEAAFEQAALAMTAVMAAPETVRAETAIAIHCEAPSLDLLFVDWLNALVFESDTRKLLFSKFKVSIQALNLEATAWGEAVEVTRHQPAAEVKGATYTTLKVEQDAGGLWCAQCVVDV
jgi:tRNA nucleotidyltransferase (CCA-adding enzyme)